MLLAGPRNSSDTREIEIFFLHPGKKEIQCLDPHSHWGIDFILSIVGMNTLLNVVVRKVCIKGDYLLL